MKRPRSVVVAVAATIGICVATAVYSYHYGYLQGTRETIENNSLKPIFPETVSPMPTSDPARIQVEFHRNAAGQWKPIVKAYPALLLPGRSPSSELPARS